MTNQALIHCINLFAEQHSNPVLSVLPSNGVVEFKRKYPEPDLSFSNSSFPNTGLHAYYHCHTSSSRPNAEHGHFHIFLRVNENQWSHLVGLSMDSVGQPLQWVTVNHWVTAETWCGAKKLQICLENLLLKDIQELEMTESWLLAMLEFYKKTLKEILVERDQQVEKLTQEQKIDSMLQDRSIYLLSQRKISLLNDLKSCSNLNDTSRSNS
jgi:hypothetical protein